MSFLRKLRNKEPTPPRSSGGLQSSSTKSASRTSSKSPSPPPARPRAGTDPETCLEVFQSHWNQAWLIINKLKTGSLSPTVKRTASEEAEAVTRYIDQMVLLLMEEESQDGGQGPILQYLLMEDILEKIMSWVLTYPSSDQVDKLMLHQLRMFDQLVGRSQQQMLIHKPIIRPLLKLLSACKEHSHKLIEKHLLLVLSQLSVCLAHTTELLELLFDASSDQGPARFLMFSILIPYTHREGTIGQQARDALLLIMSLSSKHDHVGRHVAEQSDFCPVLATGLSGLYSALPRKLNIPSDDWHHLTDDDLLMMPDLSMFLNSLEFCNAVVQVAHPLVKDQLLSFIYHGFLVPVMGPALHQSSMDEIITATAYLELFVRRITEPAMMRTFLKFILAERYEGEPILRSLIARINSTSRLCMVSLSLFLTLLDLNCEDVMFELVFRYLIPCSHVMVSQRRSVKDLDLYSKTAEKFLSLKPACCLPDASDTPPDGATTPISMGSMSAASSSPPSPAPDLNRTMPFRRTFSFRSKARVPEPLIRRGSVTEGSSSPDIYSPHMMAGASLGTQLLHFDSSYIEYLDTVHEMLQRCADACQCWHAPYDGDNPTTDSLLQSFSNDVSTRPQPVSSQGGITKAILKSGDATVSGSASAAAAADSCTDTKEANSDQLHSKKNDASGGDVTDAQQSHSNSKSNNGAKEQLEETTPTDTETVDRNKPSGKTNYADSVTSDTDSGLSAGSLTNQSVFSDTALTESTDGSDLTAFLLSLKRVKTPVECCDNIDDSCSEIDSLLSELHNQYDNLEARSAEKTTKEDGEPSESLTNGQQQAVVSKVQTVQQSVQLSNGPATEGNRIERTEQDQDLSPTLEVPAVTLAKAVGPVSSIISLGGNPEIGPFLQTLLTKLESMISNTLYVNLLLTAVISRLACYPQPLLRSFLLNTKLVFQPTVKSLVQVLGSVKHRVDCYSYTIKEFDVFLLEARRYLAWREEMHVVASLASVRGRSDSTVSLPPNLLRSGMEQAKEKKKGAFSEFLFGRNRSSFRAKSPMQSRLQMIDNKTMQFVNRTSTPSPALTGGKSDLEIIRTKNAVYCAIVLEEFLKELAAISQEHAIICV